MLDTNKLYFVEYEFFLRCIVVGYKHCERFLHGLSRWLCIQLCSVTVLPNFDFVVLGKMETLELADSTGLVGHDATVLHIDNKPLGCCGRCKDCARNAAVNLLDTHDDILVVEHTNFIRHIHYDGDELTTPSLGKAEIVIPGGINTVNSVARLIAVDCSFECIRAIQTVAQLVGNHHFLRRTQPVT